MHGNLLGLDVGAQRIGVAMARGDVLMASPLTTLQAGDGTDPTQSIVGLVVEHDACRVVVGWPRGLAGQHTEQTRAVERFVEALQPLLTPHKVGIEMQDEALTSQKAEAELAARRKPYVKGDVDALAATFILEDYINEHMDELRSGAAHV